MGAGGKAIRASGLDGSPEIRHAWESNENLDCYDVSFNIHGPPEARNEIKAYDNDQIIIVCIIFKFLLIYDVVPPKLERHRSHRGDHLVLRLSIDFSWAFRGSK